MAGFTIQGKNFSEYTIYWAEIRAEKGVVTMSDQRKINFHAYRRCDACRKHFPNKQKALEWVKNFNQNLDKRYSVRLFTDKQFGMMKDGVVPFTSKQLEEVYYIG
jgi:2-hydroxy-3-keto-5-methylthiopentenyl-1-phosphate phosphatase